MNPFIWATTGGFAARTLDTPLTPIKNLSESIFYAGLFATQQGQKIILGVGGRLLSIGGSAAIGVFGSYVVGVTLGAAAGATIGAGVGTGLGYLIDDKRGAEAARELYTGQVRSQEYQATLLGAIASVIT